MKIFKNNQGFTLVEVVVAIVIAGILSAVAIRSTIMISETGKTEMTKTELNDIAKAIYGNQILSNNGVRSDYGYIGDIGSMPPDLDALVSNPGGYSTWSGPYLANRFKQISTDYKSDAWGVEYTFNGMNITSTGSGSNIVMKLGNSESEFLYNKISGNIYDLNSTPPGLVYRDSVLVELTMPNGSGGYITRGVYPDIGGFFEIDSIPIGNHSLNIIYLPENDTLKRFVNVNNNSNSFYHFNLSENYWVGTDSI